MTYRWGWLPLAACMLALVTAPAAAQTTVRDGQSDYVTGKSPYTGADTTFFRNVVAVPGAVHDATGEKWEWMNGDGSGNLKTSEAFPEHSHAVSELNWFHSDSLSPLKTWGDSSGVLDLRTVASPMLVVRLTHLYKAAATCSIRVAFQIRVHTAASADSASMYPWTPQGRIYPTSGGSAVTAWGDSIGTAILPNGIAKNTDTAASHLPALAGTTEFIHTFVPNATGAVPRVADVFAIPLTGLKNTRISIRVRQLGATQVYAAPRIAMSVQGGSL